MHKVHVAMVPMYPTAQTAPTGASAQYSMGSAIVPLYPKLCVCFATAAAVREDACRSGRLARWRAVHMMRGPRQVAALSAHCPV